MSSNAKKRYYDGEMQNILSLGQQAAIEYHELSEYACNVYAKEISMINIQIFTFANNSYIVKRLQIEKAHLIQVGRAMWFQKADPLSNLGALVGSNGIQPSRSGSRVLNAATF